MTICASLLSSDVDWLASRYANCNESNANFGLRNVRSAYLNGNEPFNSSGTANAHTYRLRPVASINCGYIIMNCIRDNIETNCDPLVIEHITIK